MKNLMAATALLFLSVNVTVAQDERPFLKTRRGTFTVEQINKDEKNTCIFKNGAKFYCAEEAYIDVRKTIKLRNYTVALFTANEGGSGTRWDKVGFLVVGPRKAVIKELTNECFECKPKVKRVNVAANQFELKIGNIKGDAVSALFRNGKTHLKKRKISKNTPLQREDCKSTYQLLESCPKREAPECGPDTARGDNATHFFMWGIKNDYPGFPGKEFDAECVRHCKGKPLMTRASFYKKFCRIK